MPGALDIVTLDEARAFLNIDSDDSAEDSELGSFITAITDVVEAEVGPIVPRSKSSIIYTCGELEYPAPDWPIVSLTSGAYLDDSTAVDITRLIFDRGVLLTNNASPLPGRPWTLTYSAGRAVTPDSIKKGALEVLKLAWGTQRGQDAPAFLIPYRAAAWFKSSQFSLGFA